MTTAAKTPAEDLEDQEVEQPEEEYVLDMEEHAAKERPAVLFRTDKEREEGKEATRYELRVPEDMGVAEEQLFRSEIGEYGGLMQSPVPLKKAERAKLELRLKHLFDKVLIAPPEIKAEFNDRQKQRVVRVFQIALLRDDAVGIESAIKALPEDVARTIGSTMET